MVLSPYNPRRLTFLEMEGMAAHDLLHDLTVTAARFEKANSVQRLLAMLPEQEDMQQFAWTPRYKKALPLVEEFYRQGVMADGVRKVSWFSMEQFDQSLTILRVLLQTMLLEQQYKMLLATYVYTRFFYQDAS